MTKTTNDVILDCSEILDCGIQAALTLDALPFSKMYDDGNGGEIWNTVNPAAHGDHIVSVNLHGTTGIMAEINADNAKGSTLIVNCPDFDSALAAVSIALELNLHA